MKDAYFLLLVNELNLSEEPIVDPKTAEKLLTARFNAPDMSEWAYAQPREMGRRFARVGQQDSRRGGQVIHDPAHLNRVIDSGQEWGPPFLAKQERRQQGQGPDDMSGGDQTKEQPTVVGPGEVWVRPYEQDRRGKIVPIRGHSRHHAFSQHEGDYRLASATDETATDAGQPEPRRRQADAEAYLRWKLDNRNNNGDNRLVDSDVTPRNADGQPSVNPASSTTERSSSEIEAYRKAFSRNRWHGYRDAYKWLNDPDSYPDSDPIHDPDFHAAHPGWLAGYKDAAAVITQHPEYKKGFVPRYNDFKHGDNTVSLLPSRLSDRADSARPKGKRYPGLWSVALPFWGGRLRTSLARIWKQQTIQSPRMA